MTMRAVTTAVHSIPTDRKPLNGSPPRPWAGRLAQLSALLCLIAASPLPAAIQFEDVSARAGIDHAGQSYGASWGDFDGDGWPDLWVGNHDSKPTLYLNRKDGRFSNIIDQVWAANPHADTHGAAWADFDNDGDQDLIEVVGALQNIDGTFCFGCGLNHLFLNEGGRLVESAKKYGLATTGFARTPLWLDADRDGRLDLVVANTRLGGGSEPSWIFRQKDDHTFEKANKAFGFKDDRWSRRDEYLGMARNALRFEFGHINLINMHKHLESAQLSNLLNDREAALILLSSPTRVYSIDDAPFTDMTATMGFPPLDDISDAAIADFDNDGKPDIYLTIGPWLLSEVIQPAPDSIEATLTSNKNEAARTLRFHAPGRLDVRIFPAFIDLSTVYVGPRGAHPESRSFSLSSDDPMIAGTPSPEVSRKGGFSITFDAESGDWVFSNISNGLFVDLIVQSSTVITGLRQEGFEPFREHGVDALLMRGENGYTRRELSGEAGADTACHSVAAGDFDNDMDIDLYLVCSGAVANLPNRLLENDGKGNFTLVPEAGGAAGSPLGRGDVVAIADYDRDGFLDLFVTNGMDPTSPFVADGPHQLFRNLGNGNHWIEIDLEGTRSNRDGIGAVVTLTAGGVTQTRIQGGGIHRIAQNFQRLHFGLGSHAEAEKVTIHWPSGATQTLRDLQGDRILRVREGTDAQP